MTGRSFDKLSSEEKEAVYRECEKVGPGAGIPLTRAQEARHARFMRKLKSIKGSSMSYWLTTHYRHQSEAHPYNIYVKDEYKKRAEKRISVGDKVVFYELKGKADGREKVVAVGEVVGAIRENKHRDGGPDIGDQVWDWEFPCSKPDQAGGASKDGVKQVLGWGPRRTFLVRGGVMRLDEEEFEKIVRLFKRNA